MCSHGRGEVQRLVDGVVRADQEIRAGAGQLVRRRPHQGGNAVQVPGVQAGDVIRQRMGMQ